MEDARLMDMTLGANRRFWEILGRLPGAELFGPPGVSAPIVSAAPDRSVVNSVSYDDDEALRAAYDRVAERYAAAGVTAWTVWVPAGDRDAARLLERMGHVLDGSPAVMAASIDAVEPPALAGIEWEHVADHSHVGPINDAAYGFDGSITAALRGVDDPRLRSLVAWSDDRPVACLMTVDERDHDCHVAFVATVPEARGRGLATALLAQALVEARDRGARTSTLVSSKAGRPVYERLGYRVVGTVEMWERRR